MASEDPLARLEQGVQRLAPVVDSVAWEQSNRLGLLWVHVMTGLAAGLLILMDGTAATLLEIHPSATVVTGVPAIAGGCILAVGLASRPRRVLVEVAGLVVLAVWDATMGIGFFISALHQPEARWYPFAVYLGFLALIVVHLWTLRTLWRSRRDKR